ncbi:hypothetical protein DZ860_03795 [Vibrio sinensis]|uniref:Pilus assembly protein PilW n=1 Tax=Vibrio sinensis TaxID=2302434 RepID=A0A3A6QNM8_9VIBR|nr:hypothetical protein [Vibrio sinensis]RJX74265.1 hypothetical protein DZ860_03795 [Vibrio sinensis]
MAIKGVNLPRFQGGAMLVEVLIASVLGLTVIGMIVGIFLSGYRIASNRTLELLTLQNLTITTQMMRSDIQRAGYSGGLGHSLTLLDESEIIAVSGSSIGFVYFDPHSALFQHVKYKLLGNQLYTCEKKSAAIQSFSSLSRCHHLFDQNMLVVPSFAVSTVPLSSSSAQSAMIHFYLEAELRDGRFNHSVSMSVKQRNWQ